MHDGELHFTEVTSASTGGAWFFTSASIGGAWFFTSASTGGAWRPLGRLEDAFAHYCWSQSSASTIGDWVCLGRLQNAMDRTLTFRCGSK